MQDYYIHKDGDCVRVVCSDSFSDHFPDEEPDGFTGSPDLEQYRRVAYSDLPEWAREQIEPEKGETMHKCRDCEKMIEDHLMLCDICVVAIRDPIACQQLGAHQGPFTDEGPVTGWTCRAHRVRCEMCNQYVATA